MAETYSIVEYSGLRHGFTCGYCGSTASKYSHGMWAHSMTVQDYQDLIDRGWRRSGKYCYKPSMDKTCCPQYVIKCVAREFKLHKSHKKGIKRVNKYLNSGVRSADGAAEGGEADDIVGADNRHGDVCFPGTEQAPVNPLQNLDLSKVQGPSKDACSSSQSPASSTAGVLGKTPGQDCDTHQETPGGQASSSTRSNAAVTSRKEPPKPGVGADPTKPKCKKAKVLRQERKLQRMAARPEGLQRQRSKEKKTASEAKQLEDYLLEIVDAPKHKLETRLVQSNPRSPLFEETFEESYQVYKRYQMVIHRDPPDKPTSKQFTRFLIDSPLQPVKTEGGPPEGYGSFHQQYLLDGKIIAVGVIDILPSCVSSVYLYYDPDYGFLSPGTYSALRELAFVRQLNVTTPSISFYYMGFYIHSCPKMRYKGQYPPSFLLCPDAYTWQPIERCRPLLDASKYCRLDPTRQGDIDGQVNVSEVLVLFEHQALPYILYRALNVEANDQQEVTQYARLVGKKCAKRMLLYRSA